MQSFAAPISKSLIAEVSKKKIFDLVSNELKLVEEELERQVDSNIQVVKYLCDYLRSSGGKRVRPALFILTNYASGGTGNHPDVVRLAAVMEMLHTATLVHDDIIDNADMRRNRPSVNARFGNQAAVLMGDWLYMSAFETALGQRSLEILDILTQLTRRMTEGELIQMTMVGRLDITESDYFDILKRKTAYLFSACCEIAAILANRGPEVRTAMRDYGLNLGIAFQLADDLLDITSDAETIGKSAGADLLEGKLTLPLILLLQKNAALKQKLESVMLSGSYNAFSRDELFQLLEANQISSAVRNLAESYATDARKNLDVLPETEYRFQLEAITNFVIDRNR